MQSIRRSCHSALRASNGLATSASASVNGSRRAFSRTAARSKGGLPVYVEPSSTDLESLLATINSKVLLPEHLTREQQRLVYKHKSHAKLESEPVEVTAGDITLPLEFIDRNHLPNRWESLRDVVNQSETTADWENVVRLLEGFHSAGIAAKPQWQEFVVRKLIDNGHHNLVLKALQRVKATGLRLSNYSVTARILKGAHDRAAESDWDKEETIKALRFARQVVELMEDEEHHARLSRSSKSSQADWRSKPYVVAVPTELAAIVAQKHNGDLKTVRTLASRLVNTLKQDSAAAASIQGLDAIDSVGAFSSKTEADFNNKSKQTQAINDYSAGLFESLVVWHALTTSKAVLGADMPLAAEAAHFEARLKKVLDQGLEALPKFEMRGEVELRCSYPAYLREQLQKCQA